MLTTTELMLTIFVWSMLLNQLTGGTDPPQQWLKIQPNSHAVAMADAQPLGIEMDFARNPFSGLAA